LCVCALGSLAYGAPALEDYARSPAIELVRLSPSGDQYALITTNNSDRRLLIARTDGAGSTAIDLGKLRICDIEWAGEDRVVISTTTIGKLGPGFTESKAWMMGRSS